MVLHLIVIASVTLARLFPPHSGLAHLVLEGALRAFVLGVAHDHFLIFLLLFPFSFVIFQLLRFARHFILVENFHGYFDAAAICVLDTVANEIVENDTQPEVIHPYLLLLNQFILLHEVFDLSEFHVFVEEFKNLLQLIQNIDLTIFAFKRALAYLSDFQNVMGSEY